ncbi:related to AMFR protein [Cephalotrichum gorgonifer]|uniref:Related to AMFR protein n=1 Tax=Cephalotrichum gorgonifer TaxID=2041049 RepID=A0AAE8MU22_9PEZI|nr:related to AMFR protein [Cephalotrichum gorgonifer]
MSDQQVSLPFLLIVVLTLGLATRYLFFTPSSPSSSAGGSRSGRDANSARRREAAAETILQMFPQADRRAVLWDLARNGGSVQVTSERILAGRLDTPPVTFQPPPPPGSNNAAAAATPSKPRKPTQPDLITRYNLQSKIGEAEEEGEKKKEGWSASREERQALLKRRRDEMILAARRKMEARIEAEKDGPPRVVES